jgi:hypothetical protein
MKHFLIMGWMWLAAGIGLPVQATAGEQERFPAGDSMAYTTIQGTVRERVSSALLFVCPFVAVQSFAVAQRCTTGAVPES